MLFTVSILCCSAIGPMLKIVIAFRRTQQVFLYLWKWGGGRGGGVTLLQDTEACKLTNHKVFYEKKKLLISADLAIPCARETCRA